MISDEPIIKKIAWTSGTRRTGANMKTHREYVGYLDEWDGTERLTDEEIVRCRDCEHARIMRPLDWRTGEPSTVIEEWYCHWHSNAEGASDIDPDGFCAWGERRDA